MATLKYCRRLALLLLLLAPTGLQAQYNYSIYLGVVTITGPSGIPTALTIPATINNDPVTTISLNAFYNCHSLTSVSIPASVTNIGSGAFGDCPYLASISVAASNPVYSSINGVLFDKSGSLLIQCPGGWSGSYPVPNGVTSIGASAFLFCSRLTGVTIPNSVTNLGTTAFFGCSSLVSMTLGNQVTTIGASAFNETGLTNVMIPASVNDVEDSAFDGCPKLVAITVAAANTHFFSLNGVLFNQNGTQILQYPNGLSGGYTIPNGVTSIGNSYEFYYCGLLTSLTIPSSVTNIVADAFLGCSSLANVYFRGNAPSVGTKVFVANPQTVYYLPGTKGWASFATNGVTPVLWIPQAQTRDGSFGLRTNQFGFNLSGTSNLVVVVEGSTNLANWSPVSTNTVGTSTAYFNDPQWTNYRTRYYRIRSP